MFVISSAQPLSALPLTRRSPLKDGLDYFSPMIFLWSILVLASQYFEMTMLRGNLIEATSELSGGLITNVIIGIILKTGLAIVGMISAAFYVHKLQFKSLKKAALILLGASSFWTVL